MGASCADWCRQPGPSTPTLATLVVVQVIYRAGRYGMTKPAREVLFTVVSREEKYKSKAFIDAGVYRGGDLVSGWIYAGLAWVGQRQTRVSRRRWIRQVLLAGCGLASTAALGLGWLSEWAARDEIGDYDRVERLLDDLAHPL